ncbi:MAG: ribosome maturation factor RimM [Deltaproteobacteria bacterium]|nr:ribosome maturation factor RimM [Deltaproteobacteria bacterium]
MKSDFLVIGKVAKPHGLRGQVKVQSYASSYESFFAGSKVYLSIGEEMRELVLSEVKVRTRSLLLNFQGVDNRQQAEGISGSSLYIKKKDLKALPEGEYYWYQLIGSRVYNDQGRFLGIMEEIFPTPAHDIWVIRDGKKELLLPAVEDFVVSVNIPQREIRVRDLDDSGDNDTGHDR